MSDKLRILIEKNGTVHVKLDTPHGRACDQADARIRALHKLMGIAFEDEEEHPDRIPHAQEQREKTRA